jgi:putative methylase
VLYFASGRGDIAGRSVVDLGTGNGILAIGARLLGASQVEGIETDASSLEVARRNARRSGVDVNWILADVQALRGPVETVLMNPPFGAQTRGADRPFLDAAMAHGQVVYMFLNPKSEDFVRRRIETSAGRITDRLEYAFPIPHLFPFHREEVRALDVLLYRVEMAKG